MFCGGDFEPMLRFTRLESAKYDLFSIVMRYILMSAAVLAVFYCATLILYVDDLDEWTDILGFCLHALIVVTIIWDLFYESHKMKYGYKEAPTYQITWTVMRVLIVGAALVVCAICLPAFWNYLLQGASLPEGNNVLALGATLIMIAVYAAVISQVIVLSLYRYLDQRSWHLYIADEYDIINEKPPLFVDYCQKFQ